LKSSRRRNYLFFAVFASGLTTLAVELTASRLLGNIFGTSNLVWASIIGLILIYLTAGYFLGGRLADKRPYPKTLFTVMLWGGFLVGVVPFSNPSGDPEADRFTDSLVGPMIAELDANGRFRVIERERLLNSVRRIALMTHERSHGFKYVLTSGQLELSVSNPDMGEARELVPIDYDGDRFETSFSARYVQDALAAMKAKEVAIELVDELTAAVIRPADDPDQLAVVAPMRL